MQKSALVSRAGGDEEELARCDDTVIVDEREDLMVAFLEFDVTGSRGRETVVPVLSAVDRPPVAEPAAGSTVDPDGEGRAPPRGPPEPVGYVRPRYFRWADLLRRVFEIDVLACADCGGRLRLVATIDKPSVIARILEHLGLPVDPPDAAPARPTGWLPGWSE